MSAIEAGAGSPRLFPLNFREPDGGCAVPIGPTHIRSAIARGLPEVRQEPDQGRKCVIVAGSPSVLKYERELRKLYDEGHYFVAINQVHNWLIEKGMPPHGQIIFEVGPIMDELQLELQHGTTYYACSMCCPETFDALDGFDVKVWHAWTRNKDHADAVTRGAPMVGGGSTTLGRAIPLMTVCGFRDFEVFGGDSSFDGQSHFNGTPHYLGEKTEVQAVCPQTGEVRKFMSAPYLLKQAFDMKEIFQLHHDHFRCRMHGDGLLPWMHRTIFPTMYAIPQTETTNG